MFHFVYIVLSCLDFLLVFLLSTVTYGLFPPVVLFVLFAELLFFFSSHVLALFLFFFFFFFFACVFLICVSNRISHPDFEFLFVFFRTPILSPTNFASAWISLFNSVMFFFEICVHNSFIFSVSAKTVLVCVASIVITLRFISVKLFLFFSMWCIDYCIRVLLPCLPI